MRISPIEHPKELNLRMAYWFMDRFFGKVMTPAKVVTARMPGSLKLTVNLGKFATKGLTIDHELHLLISALTSEINGCAFCLDLAQSFGIREKLNMKKFEELPNYRTSPVFTARDRAALAYTEEITRNARVEDGTFEELKRHFNDREIVEITFANALENFYNLINVPLEIESDGFCAMAQEQAA